MDAPHPKEVSDIFAALGGTGAAGKVMGVGQSTASEMRRRSSIPVKYWDRIIGHIDAEGRAITLEDLHEAHRERAPAPEPAQ